MLRTLYSRPEVAVPAFTFVATADAAWNAGLRPVFCDVDPDTFNVTADTVACALTDRTVAVVPVHLFGQMAPVEGIHEALAGRDILLLEDSAQATGSRCLIGGDWVATDQAPLVTRRRSASSPPRTWAVSATGG
jgi:dTDP-4-amino-4,6-dideoxygalactose transaminase